MLLSKVTHIAEQKKKKHYRLPMDYSVKAGFKKEFRGDSSGRKIRRR